MSYDMIKFKCLSGTEIVMPVSSMTIFHMSNDKFFVGYANWPEAEYHISEEEHKRLCDIIGV